MAKQKKKRNKRYSGQDAAVTKTTVTRISAEEKSRLREWWDDNRKKLATRGIVTGVVIILGGAIWFISGFILGLIF